MGIVGRLDQYSSMLSGEFDEVTGGNLKISGFGTYFASEFSENVGIGTTLTANVFPPYNIVYDDFGGNLFGPGQGRYMRQNTDTSVVVYNEIDEVTDFRDIVRTGLVLDLDAAQSLSYNGSGITWTDISGQGKNGTLTGPTYSSGAFVFDGVDDVVESTSNLTLGGSFSVSLWVKHNISAPVQERYISLGSDRIVIQENENADLNLYVTDGTQQNLWLWGSNISGELGINDVVNRSTPVTTILGGTNWKSVSCGQDYTAAIKTDGTLWVWGIGGNGRLGINDTNTRSTPITTILGGTNWKSVNCGFLYTVAIKTDGTLWSWGRNNFGQLGIDATTDRSTPVTTILGGTNWKSVSGGYNHTAAIKTDETLWSWGRNSYGQLGVNDTTARSTPVTTILGGTNWKSISSGIGEIAAIKTDGTLWVWGNGGSGRLGINATTNRSTPVTTILGGTNWKSVSASSSGFMAAIKTDGTLWMWGFNALTSFFTDGGHLGINDRTNRSTPVTTILGGTNWKSVDCGQYHTVAIKTNGTLWTWGDSNNLFQLGNNDTRSRSTPVTTILGGTNWKSASVGSDNTIAIKTNATFINDVSTNATITNSTYYNIVATSDGSILSLYKDGTLVATETLNGTLNSTSLSYTLSSALESFAGSLASVQVYNKALTTSEVTQNYNALKHRFGL